MARLQRSMTGSIHGLETELAVVSSQFIRVHIPCQKGSGWSNLLIESLAIVPKPQTKTSARVPRDRSNRCEEPTNIILFYLFSCSRDLRRVVGLNGTGVRLKRSPSRRGFFELSHLMEIPMIRCTTLMLIATAIVTMSLSTAYGQTRTNQNRNNPKDSDEKPTPPPLPTDQRLLALHRTFVQQAEKLALEYERGKDFDKAKAVYGEILKLVPQYESAKAKMAAINQMELTAGRARMDVKADKSWQDTGITVIAGKPIAIRAYGTWTFTFTAELSAEGIAIPKELREYNLGSLIGSIDTGRGPGENIFVVGPEKSFVAETTGRLYLQMYDNNVRDNEGSLKVEFLGSFDSK